MKVEFNTLYWSNTPSKQIDAHKSVTDHFNLPVNYYDQNIPHGAWMDWICNNSTSDVIVFFDADCVPIDYDRIKNLIKETYKRDSFLGIAQVSNHIPPKSHIYAAPAFYIITKKCWDRLATSFAETIRSDVGEELCYKAEAIGQRYKCLYPSTFEREPAEGVWPLGNYGYYGVGTTFDNTVYHLYQGRMGNNLDLFTQRCQEIIQGNFDNRFHISSTSFYTGKIVP